MKYGRMELAKFFGLPVFEDLVQVITEFLSNYGIFILSMHLSFYNM